MAKGLAIVTGHIARERLGGVTLSYIQYMLALRRLGWKVFYYEECPDGILDPFTRRPALRSNIRYLAEEMGRTGFCRNWVVKVLKLRGSRFIKGCLGDPERIIASADVFLNVSGACKIDDKRIAGESVYIDSDPLFTQVRIIRDAAFASSVRMHRHHFTFAGNIASRNFPIRRRIVRWIPTEPPCDVAFWDNIAPMPEVPLFTTIGNWDSYDAVSYRKRRYWGSKAAEFSRIACLPRLTAMRCAVSLLYHPRYFRRILNIMESSGWDLHPPRIASQDSHSIRKFVLSSSAELSVAKHGYVYGQTGWFSDRSSWYLAAGRPVVIQDTGFSARFRAGRGLFPFSTLEEAAEGMKQAVGDLRAQSRYARELAREHFEGTKVLSRMLRKI